jgi:hypothetical protein
MTEQNIVIYIGIYKSLGIIGVIVSATWYASYRLARVETRMDRVEKRMDALEGQLDQFLSRRSPLALLEKGKEMLQVSELKEYIDDHEERLLAEYGRKMPLSKNPYDIQETAFTFFRRVPFEKTFEERLKTIAFMQGVSIESLRTIGGVYFRDVCLRAMGFGPEDLR